MNKRFAMRSLISIVLGVMVLVSGLPSDAFAARKDCGIETDTGNRIKCKMENLNDSFDTFVSNVVSDDTGTFSEKQKQQMQNLRDQAHNEADRTPSEDFKQILSYLRD